MNRPRVPSLAAGDHIIPLTAVKRINIVGVEQQAVLIHTDDGSFPAYGLDAIEAVMIFKPSALEGRRLKWKKNAWAFHNIVAHPLMQILAWLRLYKLAMRVHDDTTPTPRLKSEPHIYGALKGGGC